jgi:hypothetical protein
MSMKIPVTPYGIEPATFPDCSAVPQPTAPPRAPTDNDDDDDDDNNNNNNTDNSYNQSLPYRTQAAFQAQ